jgi:hypothetical protein
MRILLSCLQDLRPHPIPSYRFWANYFRNGIVEAGHKFIEIPNVDWAEGCASKTGDELQNWREATWTHTLKWIRSEHTAGREIDLFLSYLYPQQVDAGAIDEIKDLGIPCVNFFCDNVREYTNVPSEFHCFSLHWVPEFEALPMYTSAGLKTCFAPMPCWVPAAARTSAVDETSQVTFIGSSDELRRALFSKALSLGVCIGIGGAGWGDDFSTESIRQSPARSILETAWHQVEFLRTRGMQRWIRKITKRIMPSPEVVIPSSSLLQQISDGDYVKLTKNSMITLGVNRVPSFQRSNSSPLKYSRLRDIEAPMMGACYLTEYTKGVAQLYDVGREVETYETAEELRDKINDLQKAPKRRAFMRQQAQIRALSEHSIPQSLWKISQQLGL